jgi:conjugal transfer mating pair stabilization protein TraN
MLVRFVCSLFYATLLLSLSGAHHTALALVSCQDRISANTPHRYIDALALFTEYNGTTYAIAKSAVSGSQSLPDGYFNFEANISREYLTTGTDTASLKRMLALGRFGEARPVRIDSRQTLDFVLKRFGAYLGSADSPRSTYIDAWKEFGLTGFTALDGTGLSFTNWGTGTPYGGQDPQAVVMGRDGIWTSGLDGVRSSQIVQFSGKLDCSYSYIDPTTLPPVSPSATETFGTIICAQDLNNNGYAADPGEVATCVVTPQGQYCPVGSVECDLVNSAYVCPLGSQYVCMEYQGVMRCSSNSCFDQTTTEEEADDIDESMLRDDGDRDALGQCLGQLYVFNGKASRCRPPGMKVGMINDCCESDQVAAEDTGDSILSATQGIQMAYEIGQVAYYGNALLTGAAQISAITTTATGTVASMTVVTAAGTTTTLSGAVATGAYATMASGATGASAIGAGLQAYATALLNPTTIAVAVAVMVAMKLLMGGGCDQGDIQTAMQNAAKDCHYVGNYCQKKWPLVGCVQKAKSYCCFNSKMARIIHEQGRPQLLSFQPNGAWGSAKHPNCRGFTPEEFQALDFSRIDLSEYFADVQKDLATKIQGTQQTIMQNIQNKYQATPK